MQKFNILTQQLFLPYDDVENFIAQFHYTISNGKYVMISSCHKYSTIFLKYITTSRQPLLIKCVDVVLGRHSIPFAFIKRFPGTIYLPWTFLDRK